MGRTPAVVVEQGQTGRVSGANRDDAGQVVWRITDRAG